MKMRKVESVLQDLDNYFYGKKILEIACGDSDFSLNVSKYAKEVLATDISLERVKRRNLDVIPPNIEFKEMDATNLDIDNDTFDVCVCYNALGHLENQLRPVLIEMIRVTIQDGYLIFIATWKMDKKIITIMKDIVREYNSLTIYDDIQCNKYNALIIKRRNE